MRGRYVDCVLPTRVQKWYCNEQKGKIVIRNAKYARILDHWIQNVAVILVVTIHGPIFDIY